jgi:long-subunit acyl-CoA synthetase (AMP-forming)
LTEVQPTLMLGVPRVWEKIEEKMKAVGAANSGVKKALGDWAKRTGLAGHKALLQGDSVPWGWALADFLVFSSECAHMF